MKFMKRFLMSSVFIGGMMFPLIADAANNDAVPDNGWHRGVPAVGCNDDCVAAAVTTNRLKRNQTLYIPLVTVEAQAKMGDTETDNVLENCAAGTTCTSAPIFIATTTAMMCLDTDVESGTEDAGTEVTMYICADSTCTVATSIPAAAVVSADSCREFHANDQYNQLNVGGSWVYVDFTGAPGNNKTALVWIVGQ